MPVRSAAAALVLFVTGCAASGPAAPAAEDAVVAARAQAALGAFVARCQEGGCALPVGRGVEVDTVVLEGGALVARFSRDLGDAPVRPATAAAFEREVAAALAPVAPGLAVRVETRGGPLADLVPNDARAPADRDTGRLFDAPGTGPPLTRPADASRTPTAGLAGRHLALWPSHGWLYVRPADTWTWQRPRLFTTVEDLLTVGFVTRELVPMVERAGAVTILPRERDVRAEEVVVDNGGPGYAETGMWTSGPAGFAQRPTYSAGQNPFALGTTRQSTDGRATWTPEIPEAGAYAVHVGYAAGPDRTDAARYTVTHAGGTTDVLVNQTIGGGTWVYIGTFEFEAGRAGSVALAAPAGGVLSADAVRFGGGRGVVERGGDTSGRPRWQEAARYYEQYAGAPEHVYNVTGEPDNDYVDDYRSRGEWANWLRGAPFGPTGRADEPGLGIPVDAVLAWHTDAGIDRDGVIGTLAIYDVPGMDSTRAFPNGVSRLANRDLADNVQTQIVEDLRQRWDPDWRRRSLWDRNYSEAARPTVPALLLELLSHQNFRDMRFALDPRFQFDAARAVYKGFGRFLAAQRGEPFVPQPLRPTHFSAVLDGDAVALSWRPQPDELEPEAMPTAYVVYVRDGAIGWDNGTRVDGTAVRLPAPPVGVVRSYRVAGLNAGGEGRPSGALAVGVAPGRRTPVLVVDGFDRVAPPDAVDTDARAGFTDPVGVPEGVGVIAVGGQVEFDPTAAYEDDAEPGWGKSTAELETTLVLGNRRDHAAAHGRMLLAMGRSFSSASDEAVAEGAVALAPFAAVDLVLGLERRTPWPDPDDARPAAFEALPADLRDRLGAYLDGGGGLVVSGAHWATDAAVDPASAAWVRQRLGAEAAGTTTAAAVTLADVEARFVTAYGPSAYAVRLPDALAATDADVVGTYPDGTGAAVQRGRAVAVAVPLESILDDATRARIYAALIGRALGR